MSGHREPLDGVEKGEGDEEHENDERELRFLIIGQEEHPISGEDKHRVQPHIELTPADVVRKKKRCDKQDGADGEEYLLAESVNRSKS